MNTVSTAGKNTWTFGDLIAGAAVTTSLMFACAKFPDNIHLASLLKHHKYIILGGAVILHQLWMLITNSGLYIKVMRRAPTTPDGRVVKRISLGTVALTVGALIGMSAFVAYTRAGR